MKRLRASRSYRFVLLLVLGIFVFVMAVPDEAWALSILALLLTTTLIVAIWTSGLGLSPLRTIILCALGAMLVAVASAVGGDAALGAVWLAGVVLVAAIMAVIGLGVMDQGKVNRQSVYGAICIYLLLGLLFSFAYSAAARLGSGSFFVQGTDGTPAIRLYFSYITMATVGYGDYSPAADFGRTLAVLEGLLGQLYLVTIVALLVSRVGIWRDKAS